MNIDLSTYTIEELIQLKETINSKIYSFDDGFEYICNVRSYGRNWVEHPSNTHTLQELCYQYNGDDGIVDVYSTNPNLSHIHNYGELKHIQSVDDYKSWKNYEYLKKQIPEIEKELEEWDNRDNVPFSKRPYFEPYLTKEDLDNMKKELEEFDMSFVEPKNYS